MNHAHWQARAEQEAMRSVCKRAQVGCVIHRDERELACGYNYNVFGGRCECELSGETLKWVLHAEQSALHGAAQQGVDLTGAMVHVTRQPCANCAELLIDARISAVWYRDGSSCDAGLRLLQEAGIKTARFKSQAVIDQDFFRAHCDEAV